MMEDDEGYQDLKGDLSVLTRRDIAIACLQANDSCRLLSLTRRTATNKTAT